MMTLGEVLVRAEQVRVYAEQGDDERAHNAEDDLWRDVLQAIAAGEAEDPAEMAGQALKTVRIGFSRWTA